MLRPLLSTAILALLSTPALAEAPRVTTDIGPVQSLAAMVMEGVGAPSVILRPGASPHGYALRPSEARALEQADVVFWVSPDLTPWMEEAIHTLADDATIVELLHTQGTTALPFRLGATFEKHRHAPEEVDGHDDHGYDDHGHDDHAHDEKADDDHAQDAMFPDTDPHAWLDPENGKVWVTAMAEALAQRDPDNAATYRQNADAARARIDAASASVAAQLAPVAGQSFVVFHDSYQYFEQRFGLSAAGSISLGDATAPGPARLAEIRHAVKDLGVSCVFSEPQFNAGLVATVTEGTDTRTAELDPLGSTLAPGPDLYPQLLTAMGSAMAGCL
ncbi:zinc ABC transporter substrate-binding protein [Mesobacterium sp. TK19101]|uniref:High-affinity zinc uptake system protein ZnuA n=1 Tax=Mesobacterium hydrothermale TaxID=3111907 RepID=A0ABU6HCK4_9RHOB|nr:zinc ABC transporter substrate-binding protein [Mesobacterium sp. TK19101]MEC3859716.1 zinc ABC transporter substrate-binding protein [Mesobacterium sp. TK19101]